MLQIGRLDLDYGDVKQNKLKKYLTMLIFYFKIGAKLKKHAYLQLKAASAGK